MQNNFHDEYVRAVALLPEFGKSLKSMLERLLAAEAEREQLRVHAVDYRVKTEASAAQKTARPRPGATEAGPRSLDTLFDLLGIRVITYFSDGVDVVARMIKREFTIDWENSVDKRAVLDPDRFGYLSLHFVAQLSDLRAAMPEYQRYGHVKFEIQIRSILQHAWAEIEHDIGYKSLDAVPSTVRRRFSRLAGHLELADDEFVGIKMEIGDHQTTAKENIEQGGLGIEIDQDSLSAFVQSSPQTKALDRLIAKHLNATVQKRPDDQFLGRVAGQLKELGFGSIQKLSNYLVETPELLPFIRRWIQLTDQVSGLKRAPVPVPVGITLWYVGKLKSSQALLDGVEGDTASLPPDQDRLRRALSDARAEIRSSSPIR